MKVARAWTSRPVSFGDYWVRISDEIVIAYVHGTNTGWHWAARNNSGVAGSKIEACRIVDGFLITSGWKLLTDKHNCLI